MLLFIRTILEEMGRVKKGFQTYNDRLYGDKVIHVSFFSCYHTGWLEDGLLPHMTRTVRCTHFFGTSTSSLLQKRHKK